MDGFNIGSMTLKKTSLPSIVGIGRESSRVSVRDSRQSEADASVGKIGWSAPLARALIGARVGEERTVRLPSGEKAYEVITISYPPPAA